MKQVFDSTEKAIWKSIVGNKGFLSSARMENLVSILERDLDLSPVVLRVGDTYDEYDARWFYKLHVRDRTDGFCNVFYHPVDAERTTGSKADNWLQWSARLLNYGRGSHPLAPRIGLPEEARRALQDRGVVDNGRVTRLLSLEVVVFYLAAQTTTWSNPGRILTVKDRIQQQDILTKSLRPRAEDIDLDAILPEEPPRPTRYPKAAQEMLNYNPNRPPEEELDMKDIEAMSDDELAALEAQLKATRAARQMRVVGGRILPGQQDVAMIKVAGPEGEAAFYVRVDVLDSNAHRDLINKGLL